jgi:hypothetical protein
MLALNSLCAVLPLALGALVWRRLAEKRQRYR